jgi:hypothetical protein
MHTGVSSDWVIGQVFFERYTRVLMEASPEFPIHFLKIYSSKEPAMPDNLRDAWAERVP